MNPDLREIDARMIKNQAVLIDMMKEHIKLLDEKVKVQEELLAMTKKKEYSNMVGGQ